MTRKSKERVSKNMKVGILKAVANTGLEQKVYETERSDIW
jgi:hypothetical protein